MQIAKEDLDAAVKQGIISAEQARGLWAAWSEAKSGERAVEQGVTLPNVAYYFGALLVMTAMGWFMNAAWDAFAGRGIFLTAMVYAACFIAAGHRLWFGKRLFVPGGLLFVMAVAMTPLAVFGLEKMLGWWPVGNPGHYTGFNQYISGGWFLMELSTLVTGLIALCFVPFSFLTAPVAFTLWYMSMDITPIFFKGVAMAHQKVSLVFGLVMLMGSFAIDRRSRTDYAFWGYFFGCLAFWGGLTMLPSNNEWQRLGYFVINVAMMVLAVLLERKVLLVFGSIGVFGYLGYLSRVVFPNDFLFPVVLSFWGLAVIWAGMKYHRHQRRIEGWLLGRTPAWVKRHLPQARES